MANLSLTTWAESPNNLTTLPTTMVDMKVTPPEGILLGGSVADPSAVWWPEMCGNMSIYNAFWSSYVMLRADDPSVTSCFEQTVLTWSSYGVFVAIGFGYFLFLMCSKSTGSRTRSSYFNIFKTVLCLLLLVSELGGDFTHIVEDLESHGTHLLPADYVAMTIRFVALILATCLVPLEFTRGIVSSGILSLFWTTLVAVETIFLYSSTMRYLNQAPSQSISIFINSCSYFSLVVIQFICCLFGDARASPHVRALRAEHMPLLSGSDEHSQGSKPETEYKYGEPEAKKSTAKRQQLNPLLISSFYTRITFAWVAWLSRFSRGPTYMFNELPPLRPEDTAQCLLSKFYLKYLPSSRPLEVTRPGPLLKALLWTLRGDLLLAVTYRLLNIGAAFLIPAILQVFIYYMEEKRQHWGGYVLATSLTIANFFNIIYVNNFLFAGSVAGMKARSIVSSLICRKLMAVSSTVAQRTNLRQIVELLSQDCEHMQEFFLFAVILITSPLLLLGTLVYLWQLVGAASMAGLGLLTIVVPINAMCFAAYAKRKRARHTRLKRERVKLVDEIISGILSIKANGWEGTFKKRIAEIRHRELVSIRKINYASIFGALGWLLSPYLVSLVVFTVYVYMLGNSLEAAEVFVTLILINLLTWPLSLIPMAVTNTMKGWVSLKKIMELLAAEERDGPDGDYNCIQFGSEHHGSALQLKRASFSWGRLNRPTLRNIDLDIPQGALVAIVGLSGSGKSSLLRAILGELYRVDGEAIVNGHMGYTSQRPWVLEASFRDNIVLRQPYNEERFNTICHACDLTRAIALLPHGTRTIIQPNSPLLTKGQYQCMALARAVYQQQSIYLLDDPLSWVHDDSSRDIFDHVIGSSGLLRYQTRVLVTHDATLLPSVDFIYYLENGYIREAGSYGQLLARDAEFADYNRSYIVVENPAVEFDDIKLRDIRGQLAKLRVGSHQGGADKPQRKTHRSSRHGRFLTQKSAEARSDFTALDGQGDPDDPERGWSLRRYMKVIGLPAAVAIAVLMLALGIAQVLTNLSLHQMVQTSVAHEKTVMTLTEDGLIGYATFGAVQAALAVIIAIMLTQRAQAASRNLHEMTLQGLLRAPLRYFSTTTPKAVRGLFSKHVENMDLPLPAFLRQWSFAVVVVLSTMGLLVYLMPWMALIFAPLLGLSYKTYASHSKVSRQLKQLDRRQPFYEYVGRGFVWSCSIRAHDMEGHHAYMCDQLIDNIQRPYFLIMAAYRWCGLRVEVWCNVMVFAAGIMAAWQVENFSSGELGVIVTFALVTTLYMNAAVRNTAELETSLISVAHIEAMCSLEQEWEPEDLVSPEPLEQWPETGTITFRDYTAKVPGSHRLLTINSLEIPAAKRVGVVGLCETEVRSFLLSLPRLDDYVSGSLSIDGRDVSQGSLSHLRSKIGFLPQVPSLFTGDLLSNLDPRQEFRLDDVWNALEIANAKSYVANQPSGLSMQCGRNGEYLRPDMRHLVMIARAILQHPKILVVDHVTSELKGQTRKLVLHLLRTCFHHATVLMATQHPQELLNFDRVIVLDEGRIVECDHPAKLMAYKDSLFRELVKQQEQAVGGRPQ